jgi:PadR family transcriptional regulator, regulatory protein PadR
MARACRPDLVTAASPRAGVMYPILQRMLDEGWLDDGWEDQPRVGTAKRPPRRYYELTEEGKTALGAVIADARHDPRFVPVITRPAIGEYA